MIYLLLLKRCFIVLAADATTVAALTITLRNVAYLLSQRSAIAVRASRTWWRTAPTKLRCSRQPVLREDRKRSPSRARRRSLGRWGEGTAVHHFRRRGPSSQSGQAGPLKKLPLPSRLQHRKNKAKRGLPFKKGKRHNPSLTYHFLSPVGKSTSCKFRGTGFHIQQLTWDFLTTVEELWMFLNRQITLSKLPWSRVSCVMWLREWDAVICMYTCERERAWACVCVGEFSLECRHIYKEGLSLYMCVWRYKHTPSLTELDILQELKAHSEAVLDGFENNPWNFSWNTIPFILH